MIPKSVCVLLKDSTIFPSDGVYIVLALLLYHSYSLTYIRLEYYLSLSSLSFFSYSLSKACFLLSRAFSIYFSLASNRSKSFWINGLEIRLESTFVFKRVLTLGVITLLRPITSLTLGWLISLMTSLTLTLVYSKNDETLLSLSFWGTFYFSGLFILSVMSLNGKLCNFYVLLLLKLFSLVWVIWDVLAGLKGFCLVLFSRVSLSFWRNGLFSILPTFISFFVDRSKMLPWDGWKVLILAIFCVFAG